MSVLDTFVLLFKTDSRDAQNDIKALDKQITDLTAKGQKRDEAENKHLKELRKQRAEATRDIKDQTKEVDKLGQSFVKMVEGVAAAGTALFTLGAIKAGVQHVTDFNSALRVTASILGQNSSVLSAFASAAEFSGGTQEGAIGAYQSLFQYYSARGLNTNDPLKLLTALRKELAQRGTPAGKALLLQRLGISDTGIISLAESSDADFQKAISQGQGAALSVDQQQKLRNLKQEEVATTQELNKQFGILGAELSTYLIPALQALNNLLQGITGSAAPQKYNGLDDYLSKRGWGGFLLDSFTGGAKVLGSAAAGIGGTAWSGAKSIFGPTGAKSSQSAIDFWVSQGYSKDQAAAWAAQEQSESSGNPMAYNQGHYGLYQWSEARRKKIKAALGIDVATASAADQRKAAAWEAEQMGLASRIRVSNGAGASDILTREFERPYSGAALNAEATKRAILAGKLAIGASSSIPASGVNRGGDKNITVKTGDISVNTQATDANGIASNIGSALQKHIAYAINSYDDGVMA